MHWKPLSILSLLLLTGFATCETCGLKFGQVKEKEYEEQQLKSSCECGIQRGPKKGEEPLVNGDNVEPKNKYPWMVTLGTLKNTEEISLLCGATILSSRYVLTSAHCLIGERKHSSELPGDCSKSSNGRIFCPRPSHEVKLRYFKPGGKTEIVSFSSYKFDARYYDEHGLYDIALMRTAEELPCSEFTAPICLPWLGDGLYQNNSTATVAGWGVFKNAPKDVLREASLQISEDEDFCKKKTSLYGCDDLICAWHKSQNICPGDSGGPLFKEHKGRHYIIGVTRSLVGDCGPGTISFFVKVRKFLPWIKKHMDPKSKLGPYDREIKE